MALRADDGTYLEVKEPEVLDVDGHLILEPGNKTQKSRTLNIQPWLIPFALLFIGGFLVIGTVFIGVFFLALLAIGAIRFLFKALGSKN